MKLPFKNHTVFAGYIGNLPEVRYLANESKDAVVSLRLVSRYPVREKDGTWKSYDEWATVVLYRQLAEDFAASGHGKGAFIHVEGRRHTRQWTDGKNQKKTTHEIIAEEWHAVALPVRPDAAEPAAAEQPKPAPAPRQKRKGSTDARTESLA
jgi:single stranded DNA-binding protein